MKNIISLLLLFFGFISCQSQAETKIVSKTTSTSQKNEAKWKAELTPEQYYVLREKGTERAFTGKYWNTFEEGKYVCAACSQTLFNSDSKFASDCGWPSFDQAIKDAVIFQKDTSHGMIRTEVLCSNCKSHLGHVFNDGPAETTGERFCTNSIAIKFIATK